MPLHRRSFPWRWLVLAFAMLLAAPIAAAEDQPKAGGQAQNKPQEQERPRDEAGQADLDAAIDLKLSANDYEDLGRVLELCQKAKRRGLSDDQKRFADDLEADTLVSRGALLVDEIFEGDHPLQQKARMRSAALRDLNAAITINPEIGSAQLMLARLEALPTGNRERALEAVEKAFKLIGDDKLEQARAHLVRGGLAEKKEAKQADFDKAVELAPRNVEVRRTRGLFRLLEQDFKGAREDLEAAIEEEADDASLHEALGITLMMDEEIDDAIAEFDKAIEIDPAAAGPLLQRARALAMQGHRPEALEDLSKAIEIDPDNAVPLVLRARILQQAGDTDAALEDLRMVLADQPDNEAALELRGLIAADKGDYAAAIRDFRRLVAANGDDPLVIGQLGMLYLAAKQPREAIRRFNRALEIDEAHFMSLRGRSDAEIAIGDHRAALADLEKAHEAEPENTGVLNNLAWLLATSPDDALRDGKRAVDLAKKACELTEWKEAHIISTLAAAHAESGDFQEAKTYSAKAVETGSDVDDVKEQLRKELESYEAEKPWREKQEQQEAILEGSPPAADVAGRPVTDEEETDEPDVGDDDEANGGAANEDRRPAARTPRRPFQ